MIDTTPPVRVPEELMRHKPNLSGGTFCGWIKKPSPIGDYHSQCAEAKTRFKVDSYPWGAVLWRKAVVGAFIAFGLCESAVAWVGSMDVIVVGGKSMTATGALIVKGAIRVGTNSPPFANTGTFIIDGGNVRCGLFKIEGDPASRLIFPRGTLYADSMSVTDRAPVVVGNGTDPAMLSLGGGESTFSGGLVIMSNATLTGSGVVHGAVVNYGTISPDGVMLFTNNGQFCGNVTNYASLFQTNNGALVFGGAVDNYSRAGLSVYRTEPEWCVLRVDSIGGLTNVLESTDDPLRGDWSIVAEWVGTGKRRDLGGFTGGSAKFYRVEVEGICP